MLRTAFVISGLLLACGATSTRTGMIPDGPGHAPATASSATATGGSPGKAVRFQLPALFGDHLMRERERENAIWGHDVVRSSSNVKEPRWARYGWADNPDVSLTNAAALPAVPFEAEAR
jgi:hypothetical protein